MGKLERERDGEMAEKDETKQKGWMSVILGKSKGEKRGQVILCLKK